MIPSPLIEAGRCNMCRGMPWLDDLADLPVPARKAARLHPIDISGERYERERGQERGAHERAVPVPPR
jgi:hypothetical protein